MLWSRAKRLIASVLDRASLVRSITRARRRAAKAERETRTLQSKLARANEIAADAADHARLEYERVDEDNRALQSQLRIRQLEVDELTAVIAKLNSVTVAETAKAAYVTAQVESGGANVRRNSGPIH